MPKNWTHLKYIRTLGIYKYLSWNRLRNIGIFTHNYFKGRGEAKYFSTKPIVTGFVKNLFQCTSNITSSTPPYKIT